MFKACSKVQELFLNSLALLIKPKFLFAWESIAVKWILVKYPFLSNWINDKLTNRRYGVFQMARHYVVCPQFLIEKKQCHNRYKINKVSKLNYVLKKVTIKLRQMKPEHDTLTLLNNSNTLKTTIQKAVLEVVSYQ